MATAREDSGFGTGGKFRKRPFKRTTQMTPYDRPSTILRNHNPQNINAHNNGWLSKLVDPAQKLITAGANRLFASVFRKRLPPPPLQPETNHEAAEINQDSLTDHPSIQGAINNHGNSHDDSDSGLSELEQILKQKTYTRSEIDRLTALLHSRTSDMLVLDDEQKRRETVPSSLLTSHERVDTSLTTPIKENGSGNQQIQVPVVNSSALDEDVASPAELAKAFMENRPHKLCPSQLVPRSQVLREESTLLSNRLFSVASPSMSLVPRSSGQVGLAENGFVTPRSKGRTAIYNMARTPYSKFTLTAAQKGAGSSFESVAGPSSSSHRGTQKRRSSVLEGDIGSVGPIRRIRQKPNLLTSRTSTLGASGSLTARATGGPDAVQLSSSVEKPILLGENKDSNYPTTSRALVPSKSSETASRILQTLSELVSPKREKSSMHLSPSMLRGPALKSMENVDSSILSENIEDSNKLDGSAQNSLPDARDSTFLKRNKTVENGPTKFISSFDKLPPAMNGAMTDNINDDKAKAGKNISDSALMNSSVHSYPQKKRAFQMSAHEDYLELDDDDHSNGPKSTPLVEDRDKLSVGTDKKVAAAESIGGEGISAVTDVSAGTILPIKANNLQNDTGAMFSEKSCLFGLSAAPSPSIVPQPAMVSSNSNSVVNASPTFNFGGRDASSKESIDVPTTFNTSTADVDKIPHHTGAPSTAVTNELPTVTFGSSGDPKPGSWTRPSSYAIDTTDSKVPDSDKADKLFNHKDGAIFSTPETTSASSIFSFGAAANSSSLKNGSVASSPSLISSSPPAPITFTGQNLPSSSTTAASSVNSIPEITTSVITPAAPVFKFGSSAVSPTVAPTVSTTTEAKKKDGSFGNSVSSPIGGSSAFTSTESNIFGSTSSAAIAGTGSNIFGGTSSVITSTVSTSSAVLSTGMSSGSGLFGSTPATIGTGSSIFGISTGASPAMTSQSLFSSPFTAGSTQASSTGNGILSSSQNIPVQFGSSATSSAFGSTGNPSFPSSGSFGTSVSSAKPFSSAPTFGLNSASMSEANSTPASSVTTPSIFGSSWSAQKSPFGSTFSSSTPATFSFNASSSSAGTNSTPVFGASSGATSSSIFPFTSSTAATSSQPTFGNASSVSPFSSTPTNNNDQTAAATSSQSIFGSTGSVNPFASTQTNSNTDQITMEDSMAEDTIQSSAPTVAAFGQQSVTPSSGFVFGSTAPPSHPFQFSSQQNLVNPQNPFQPSLDFNAGGSFSLGSSGGGDKSHRKIVKVKNKSRRK